MVRARIEYIWLYMHTIWWPDSLIDKHSQRIHINRDELIILALCQVLNKCKNILRFSGCEKPVLVSTPREILNSRGNKFPIKSFNILINSLVHIHWHSFIAQVCWTTMEEKRGINIDYKTFSKTMANFPFNSCRSNHTTSSVTPMSNGNKLFKLFSTWFHWKTLSVLKLALSSPFQ